ncbi:MAG: ATP-binding protein, partial [Blastochloris sp.]|nr:ATP-binding protein [Blastochloris sp.]
MARHIAFLDREQELAHIHGLMHEWGTRRVLCIDGPGGVGKTWLLREVHRRYQADEHLAASLKVTGILDFDDFALRTPQNTAYRLAHMLDAKTFDPYLFVLHNWHRSGMGSVQNEQADSAALALNQTFVNCFNMLSAMHRVVVFVDTIDALDSLSVLHALVAISPRIDNMVLLLAGRNVAAIAETLRPDFGDDVQVIELAPFSPASSENYSARKQQQLGTSLPRPLLHKLIALSAGRPVLLNLAIEWATTAALPFWLAEGSAEELQVLPREQWATRQSDL